MTPPANADAPNSTDTGENRALQMEKLRAEIWKTAVTTEDERVLVQTLLNKVGPILDCDNVTFMPFDPQARLFKTELQWRADGQTIGLQETVPAWVFKPYLGQSYIQLSFDDLPVLLGPVLKPFSRKYGTRLLLLVPCGDPHQPEGYIAVSNFHHTKKFSPSAIDLVLELSRIIFLRTQQLQSKAALRTSERRYQQIFETNQAVKLIIDPTDGRIVEVNPAAVRFYGYDTAAFIRLRITDLNTQPEAEVKKAMIQALNRQQPFFNFEHRLASGETRQVKVYSGPIETPQGRFLYSIIHDISDAIEAETALRFSEARLMMALEGAELGAWDWDPQTTRAITNPRYLEMLGLNPGEVLTTSAEWEKVTHPDDLPRVTANLQAHLDGKIPGYRAEYRMRHTSGEWRWFLDTGKVLEWDQDGRPVRVTGILQDITARKQAEEAMRASETKLSALIENIDGSIWSVDDQYRLIVGNTGFHKNLNTVAGRPVAPGESVLVDSIPPQMLEMWRGYYDRALAGERFIVEVQRVLSNSSAQMEYRFSPIVGENGAITGVTVFGRDITEQKLAEMELRKRIEYEHLLSQISRLAIRMEDLDAFQTECLHQMGAVLNVSRIYISEYHVNTNTVFTTCEWVAPNVAPQKEIFQGVPAELTPWWLQTMKAGQVINFADIAEFPEQAERELLAAQNIKSVLAMPLFVSGEYYGFIGFDECRHYRSWPEVDVQILASASRIISGAIEHRQMERQLVQQERLAAVGQLAAGIAHDFNNILAVMLGFTEILRASPDTPPAAAQSLDQIIAAGQRAAHLVRQILDFSQKTIRHLRQIELGAFLKETAQFLEHTLPENIQINLELPPEELFIEGDPTQIQQIVTNLAINARDAMLPGGGHLTLALSPLDDAVPQICMVCQERISGPWAQITVSDTGHGIPLDVLSRVFEPFFTTKDIGHGVGLGLSQVVGVVGQHQGHIRITSRPAMGAAVVVYLPLVDAPAPTPVLAAAPPPRAGQGETILLVEDDPTVQDATRAMLEYLGYHVIIAGDGQQALALFEEHHPGIELVLSDMVMPDISGEELFYQLRASYPAVKMVLMSGYPLTEKSQKLLDHGVDWFQKPISFKNLAQVIDAAIHKKVGRWD